MDSPIIIALCGKSASGKDSTAKWLSKSLTSMRIKNNIIVSDTTRPPRKGEIQNVNYRFIDKDTFEFELNRNRYFEYTLFRGWYYGTHYSQIEPNMINIGVFNVDGLKQLYKRNKTCPIIVFYLDDKLSDRLRRSREREGRWRFEYFRRAFVDWIHFLSINRILNKFKYHATIKDTNGVVIKSRKIMKQLVKWNVINLGQTPIILTDRIAYSIDA